MPWPMVHFAIAVDISCSEPSPTLLLGSIAPDAIHMRGDVTREDKGKTHLVSNGKFPSIDTIKNELLTCLNKRTEPDWKEYVLGYFAHIYADIRWTETIYADFEKNFQGNPEDIRKTYNQEVSQIEFNLLKSEQWADMVLRKLRISSAYTMDSLVTETEVNGYRDVKLEWLRNGGNEPKIQPVYFSDDAVRKFIDATAAEFKVLLSDWGSSDSMITGLELADHHKI